VDEIVSNSNPSQFLRVYASVRVGVSALGNPPFQECFLRPLLRTTSVENGEGFDWVSFRQKEKMFDIFIGKVRSWKELYFLVKPKSLAALNNLLTAEVGPSSAEGEAPI